MDKLVETFIELAKIPSPSLGEEKVADKIIEILQEENIKAQKDDYGNVYAHIEATDNTKRPLLLSAHMDVVGDDSPVNIVVNGDIGKRNCDLQLLFFIGRKTTRFIESREYVFGLIKSAIGILHINKYGILSVTAADIFHTAFNVQPAVRNFAFGRQLELCIGKSVSE